MTRRPTTTVVITNDFPPRIGGIESFVAQACRMLDDDVVVVTSRSPGWQDHDRTLPYRVVRCDTSLLLPTRSVGQVAARVLVETGASRVLFGASAPLGLLAPRLRAAGAERIVALSHGHEVWWAQVPGTRHALRRIGARVDVLGHISAFTGDEIGRALRPADRDKLVRIAPPVDLALFAPQPTGGLDPRDAGDQPISRPRTDPHGQLRVVAAGRFVACKGWRTLLAAWRQLLANLPADQRSGVVLELVGRGPWRRRLVRAAATFPPGTVRVRDGVAHEQMPRVLAGARAFALPVRARWPGLEPEGLGMVFVEAAACGLPVLVGRSGGTPETVVDGSSGWCLDPDDVTGWAHALERVVTDASLAQRLGEHGRNRVAPRFSRETTAAALREALQIG